MALFRKREREDGSQQSLCSEPLSAIRDHDRDRPSSLTDVRDVKSRHERREKGHFEGIR